MAKNREDEARRKSHKNALGRGWILSAQGGVFNPRGTDPPRLSAGPMLPGGRGFLSFRGKKAGGKLASFPWPRARGYFRVIGKRNVATPTRPKIASWIESGLFLITPQILCLRDTWGSLRWTPLPTAAGSQGASGGCSSPKHRSLPLSPPDRGTAFPGPLRWKDVFPQSVLD